MTVDQVSFFPPRRRRWWIVLGYTSAIIAVAATAGWSVATILRPADDPLDSNSYTFVTVEEGEVGSSINLNTVAVWEPTSAGTNQASGVVTGVAVEPGAEVSPGSVLYSVNLRPVVIGQGEIPAFRAMSRGLEGADIAQLQSLLAAIGHYPYEVDGIFDWVTEQAVESWQEGLGIDETGTVEFGDVIFAPTLPARVSLDATVIARGRQISGGESVVNFLPAAPVFTIPVTSAQAAMIPTGTRVEITAPDGSMWEGIASDQVPEPDTQNIIVNLTGHDGRTICADQCHEVPVAGETLLSSRVIVVEKVVGLVVPSAALIAESSGAIAVVDESGHRISVVVVASARGMSVIEGVPKGSEVRIPATVGGDTP